MVTVNVSVVENVESVVVSVNVPASALLSITENSPACSVTSNDLSALLSGLGGGGSVTSAELSITNAIVLSLANAISVVSNALSDETSARETADDSLSNAISVLNSSYLSLVDRVSANSAVGGGGSITSLEYLSLVNRVSANSAVGGGGSVTSNELSALDARVGIISDSLSNEISNRVSVSAILDAKISALSALVVSGIASVDGRVDVVSNALSNEISNRTSADAVLDNAISIVSALNASIHTAMQEPTGFENRTDSQWTVSAAKLEITTTSAYAIWFDGVRHGISATKDISITDVEGIHLIYFDTDDALHEYVNPTTANILTAIRDKCLVAVIYWDATNNQIVYVGEERHGCVMDGITHYYLHYTRGLQYVSGLGLTGFTIGDGSADSHAQFGTEEGSVSDEDIGLTISSIASNVGYPILYMDGANAYWRTVTQAGFACYQNPLGVTNRLMYNQYTGGAWQLTEVGESNYVLYHIFATTGKVNQMYSIMGQNEYATLPAAREGATTEINSLILGTLPTPEMRPIGTVIYQTDKDYGNTINARVVEITVGGDDYVDWRTNELGRGTAIFDATPLSNAISALDVRVSALSNAISNEISNRVSVSAVLDAKISTLSALVISGIASVDGRATSLETRISTVSANVTLVDGRATSLETRISTVSSLLGGGASITSTEYMSLVDRVSANSATGGGGSVTSNEVSAIDARVGILSDAISNEISNRVSVSAVLDAKISALSAIYVTGIQSVDGRATSLETRISTVSSLVATGLTSAETLRSTLSALVVSGLASVDGRITSVAGLISVTSNELSIVRDIASAAEVHASTISARVVSVSAELVSLLTSVSATLDAKISNLSTEHQNLSLAHVSLASSLTSVDAHAAAASAAATSVGALLSAHNIQLAFNTDTQSIAQATLGAGATVSGLSVSLAISGLYTMDAMLMYTTSSTAPIRIGMIFPAMHRAGGRIETLISIVTGGGSVTQSTVNQAVGWWNESCTGSILLSVAAGGAGTAYPIMFRGMFLVSTAAGKLKLQAAGSTTAANAFHVLKGSYLRVYRIQ